MLNNENIICISSIDWDFIWQGHQEIVSRLTKNGNRVIFIENTGVRSPALRDIPRLKDRLKNYFKGVKGIRKNNERLYIFSPLVLPFPYSRIARKINNFLIIPVLKKWMKVIDFNNPIILTFLPTGIALDIIKKIDNKLVVYYCIDSFSSSSSAAKKIKVTEKKLLKKADLVFVTSKALHDECVRYNKDVSIFPFGVNMENFQKAGLAGETVLQEFNGIRKPVIGYVGGLHKWIDQELLKMTAEGLPDHSFVFVGPIQTNVSQLSQLKNVYFLGKKEHERLPLLIKHFAAAIIPYVISDYTKNVYPTKLNEYLAMGKPVISTSLPEIEMFSKENPEAVYIAKDANSFKELIIRSIKEDNETLRSRRVKVAEKNSWSNRLEQMSGLIEKSIENKMSDRELRWKENLIVFSRNVRNRAVGIAAFFIVLYLLVFYTPLVWLAAEPLKIAQMPQKADAIVVFAGGVGESGHAGQGYEERVQRAVELYKNGYADKLILSSGYVYLFKEPSVMKALAMSLGVPEGSIILEETAKDTFENVKFTQRILANNGWNRILLVSSPYHMKRASLVFHKVAGNIKVIYVPITNSRFYAHSKGKPSENWRRINIEQIRGIIHEYLGIVYYWFKGCI